MSESEFYTGGDYARRHPTWHREHSAWKAEQIWALMRRHGLTPRTATEIGCGAGGILAQLQRKLAAGTKLTGFEIAPAALEMARLLENDHLRFVQADILTEKTDVFDLLLAIDVVEHIEDYLGFLRALRPKARAHIFHLPLDLSLLSMMQPARLRWAWESVGHLHYFAKETALAALDAAGYHVVESCFTAVELDLPPPSGQQQRLRRLRRLGRRISPTWTARILGGFSLLVLCYPNEARVKVHAA